MAKKKGISVATYNDDFNQFDENIMRVRYIKYFKGTKPGFKERESIGILMGAFLSLTIGVFAVPALLRMGSHFSELTINAFAGVMGITTIVLAIWGIKKMIHENRRTYKPVTDDEFDRYFYYDQKGLLKKSRLLVNSMTAELQNEEDSIDDVEPIMLYGPEGYSSNVNLPLLYKRGQDGLIRFSNMFVLLIYQGKKGLYMHTTYLNLCDGSSKFDHVYSCPYKNLYSIEYKQRTNNIITQQGEAKAKKAKSFIITSKTGNTAEVAVDIIDFEILKECRGRFNQTEAQKAYDRLSPLVPREKLEGPDPDEYDAPASVKEISEEELKGKRDYTTPLDNVKELRKQH